LPRLPDVGDIRVRLAGVASRATGVVACWHLHKAGDVVLPVRRGLVFSPYHCPRWQCPTAVITKDDGSLVEWLQSSELLRLSRRTAAGTCGQPTCLLSLPSSVCRLVRCRCCSTGLAREAYASPTARVGEGGAVREGAGEVEMDAPVESDLTDASQSAPAGLARACSL
jgi:hypothetical protein